MGLFTLGLGSGKMSNYTYEKNYTTPNLPEYPLIYYDDHKNKLLLWISPLIVLTVWVNIYIFFNAILFLVKMYTNCVEEKNKSICTGEFKCKKGCENCVGNIFLETYV